jgi:hypothetical protein
MAGGGQHMMMMMGNEKNVVKEDFSSALRRYRLHKWNGPDT